MLNEQIIEHKLEHSTEMPTVQSEKQVTEQPVVQMVKQTHEQPIEESTEQPSESTTVDNEFESRSGGALDTLAKISGGIEGTRF